MLTCYCCVMFIYVKCLHATAACLGDAWKVLLDAAGAMIPDSEQESLISLTKFVDQLPSVLNQVHGYMFDTT